MNFSCELVGKVQNPPVFAPDRTHCLKPAHNSMSGIGVDSLVLRFAITASYNDWPIKYNYLRST